MRSRGTDRDGRLRQARRPTGARPASPARRSRRAGRCGPRCTGIHVGLAGAKVARLAQLVLGPDPSWFGPPAIEIEELLELVATEAPEIFRRPLPPFPEVVRRGGLEIHDGLVGHPGTDWEAWDLGAPPHAGQPWGFEPSRTVH